jgi:hypothetical protein
MRRADFVENARSGRRIDLVARCPVRVIHDVDPSFVFKADRTFYAPGPDATASCWEDFSPSTSMN